jgi:hypothetical protein
MALRHIGNGTFVDDDPMDVSEVVTEDLKGWKFYPYVEFASLERAYAGFILSKKAPGKSQHYQGQQFRNQLERPTIWENSLAPILEFSDALAELKLERRHRNLYEELAYVEVIDKKAYGILLGAEHQELGPKDWIPGKGRKAYDWSSWKGPGVYDMREVPPERVYRSVEEYERECMEDAGRDVLEDMYQGDEWKELVTQMVDENREEIIE